MDTVQIHNFSEYIRLLRESSCRIQIYDAEERITNIYLVYLTEVYHMITYRERRS